MYYRFDFTFYMSAFFLESNTEKCPEMKVFWAYASILTFAPLVHLRVYKKAYFDLFHWNRILQSIFSMTYEILWQEYNWIFSAGFISSETSRRENGPAIHGPSSHASLSLFQMCGPL